MCGAERDGIVRRGTFQAHGPAGIAMVPMQITTAAALDIGQNLFGSRGELRTLHMMFAAEKRQT